MAAVLSKMKIFIQTSLKLLTHVKPEQPSPDRLPPSTGSMYICHNPIARAVKLADPLLLDLPTLGSDHDEWLEKTAREILITPVDDEAKSSIESECRCFLKTAAAIFQTVGGNSYFESSRESNPDKSSSDRSLSRGICIA